MIAKVNFSEKAFHISIIFSYLFLSAEIRGADELSRDPRKRGVGYVCAHPNKFPYARYAVSPAFSCAFPAPSRFCRVSPRFAAFVFRIRRCAKSLTRRSRSFFVVRKGLRSVNLFATHKTFSATRETSRIISQKLPRS